MSINIDNLKKLIESIRNISLLQRLFSLGKVRQQIIDGVSDIQKIESGTDYLSKQNETLTTELNTVDVNLKAAQDIVSRYDGEKEKLNYIIEEKANKLTQIEKDLSSSQNENKNLEENLQKINAQLITLNQKALSTEEELLKIKQENIQLKAEEKSKRDKYEQDISGLNAIREQIQNDRNRELDDRTNAETERRDKLKETWSKHQINVKGLIKNSPLTFLFQHREKLA